MRAKGTRATVLRACRVVIRNDIPISVFLLPYAVENVLRTGSEEDMEQIRLAKLALLCTLLKPPGFSNVIYTYPGWMIA